MKAPTSYARKKGCAQRTEILQKYGEQLEGSLAKQKGGLLTGGASKVSASGGVSQDSLKEQN